MPWRAAKRGAAGLVSTTAVVEGVDVTFESMKEVKVTFLPADLDRLNLEAQKQGISRAQLIRDRALKDSGKSGNVRFDRDSYAKAVEAAARTVPGIPRAQLEHAVARVINSIAS